MAKCKASIHIDAPPSTVFKLLVEDRMDFTRKSEISWREPISKGPLRRGSSWKAVVIHERRRCESIIKVVNYQQDHVLEEQSRHKCSVTGREIEGSIRYELVHYGPGTWVVAVKKLRLVGARGLISQPPNRKRDLMFGLGYLKSLVEARHPSVGLKAG